MPKLHPLPIKSESVFSKNQLLDSLFLSTVFVFNYMNFSLLVSFFQLVLSLFGSSPHPAPSILRLKFRLFIWDLSPIPHISKHLVINFPLSTDLATSYKFWYAVFAFSFRAMYLFFISLETSSFTHGLERSVLLSFQVFGNFWVVFLFLISTLTALWSVNILCMISILLYLLRFVLQIGIYSILVNVSYMCTWKVSILCCCGAFYVN